jgi:hypothetical protein
MSSADSSFENKKVIYGGFIKKHTESNIKK